MGREEKKIGENNIEVGYMRENRKMKKKTKQGI